MSGEFLISRRWLWILLAAALVYGGRAFGQAPVATPAASPTAPVPPAAPNPVAPAPPAVELAPPPPKRSDAVVATPWTIEIRPDPDDLARYLAGQVTRSPSVVAPSLVAPAVPAPSSDTATPAVGVKAPGTLEAGSAPAPYETAWPGMSAHAPCHNCGVRMSYEEAYRSVTFRRSEYEANPSYRHEAAMEILFGTMRPTAIYRQNIPYFTRYPDFYRSFSPYPYPAPQAAPWGYAPWNY